jgi:hypothetical protein
MQGFTLNNLNRNKPCSVAIIRLLYQIITVTAPPFIHQKRPFVNPTQKNQKKSRFEFGFLGKIFVIDKTL